MSSLYVDAREEKKKSWCAPLRNKGIDAKVGSDLPADFVWSCPSGLIVVERKTWPDFVASMTGAGGADGGTRLVGQLIGTVKAASTKVLLIEGALPQYVMAGSQTLPADAIDNAVTSLQWQFGCILIHSLNEEHTPHRLATFYHYTQKQEHMSLIRPSPPMPEENIYFDADFRRKIAAMMCTPKIGEKGALLIAQETESPADAITMEQDELIKILGKSRAASFAEFWKEKW